jgi:hypothetical protein
MRTKSTFLAKTKFVKRILLAIAFIFAAQFGYSQIGINMDNSAPDASAMLDVKATGLGMLVPRMTFANRPATPATGLMIYQTNSNPGYYYYDGATWQKIGRAVDNLWALDGSDIYNTNAGNIYVGTSSSDGHKVNAMNYTTGRAAVHGIEQLSSTMYSEGMLALLNWPSNPIGLPIDVANVGVFGHIPGNGVEGAGVYGWNKDDNSFNYAGIFVADGFNSSTNYAIYAKADSASNNYAAYFDGRVNIVGNDDYDGTSNLLVSTVTHNSSIDTRAIYGISVPTDGYGYGVYGEGGYRGVYGLGSGGAYSGTVRGVTGIANGTDGTRIGVYGSANGGSINWAGYFSGDVYISSDMRIGTTIQAAGYSLSVNGKIACEEVLVEDDGSWPDYVFDNNYDLMDLDELERSINKNNHLPGLPSASEVEENGFELAGMQKLVLEKVEELTLYTIEQGKMIDLLKGEIEALKAENKKLNKAFHRK